MNYKRLLLNLLAIIHRDGGDYTGKHGIEKSVNDAMQIVVNARDEALPNILKRLEKMKNPSVFTAEPEHKQTWLKKGEK